MGKPIYLSTDARFYVAVCKHEEHTWLTLGAEEPNGPNYTLAYFGKRLAYKEDYGCQGRLKTLYSTVPGVLTRDYKFKTALNNNVPLEFEYKAFAITRSNYIEFAKSIKQLVVGKYEEFDEETKEYHKNELYYPSDDDSNRFDFIAIEKVPDASCTKTIQSDVTRLGTQDNCRHTVITLLENLLEMGKRFASGISTFAYACLPYKAVYHQDKIEGPFYILPVPPVKEDGDSPAILKARVRLFKRLSDIPKLKPELKETYEKFCALKVLYESLSDAHNNKSLKAVLQSIHSWESSHGKTIDTCRLFNTRKTRTRQVVDEVKEICQKALS